MRGFDGDLARGVAGAERERAGLRLAGNLKQRAPRFDGRFNGGLTRNLRRGLCGFPERAGRDAAVDFKRFAEGNDKARGQIRKRDKRVARDRRAGEQPAFERVQARVGEQHERHKHQREQAERGRGDETRTARGNGIGEVQRRGLARDLRDGGPAQRGRNVGGTARFVGEFHDAEEPVAEAAMMALDDLRERLRVAALHGPEPEPLHSEKHRGPKRGERAQRAQPNGRVPNAVGKKQQREGKEQPAERAADGDGGVHAPEALLHRGELLLQTLR